MEDHAQDRGHLLSVSSRNGLSTLTPDLPLLWAQELRPTTATTTRSRTNQPSAAPAWPCTCLAEQALTGVPGTYESPLGNCQWTVFQIRHFIVSDRNNSKTVFGITLFEALTCTMYWNLEAADSAKVLSHQCAAILALTLDAAFYQCPSAVKPAVRMTLSSASIASSPLLAPVLANHGRAGQRCEKCAKSCTLQKPILTRSPWLCLLVPSVLASRRWSTLFLDKNFVIRGSNPLQVKWPSFLQLAWPSPCGLYWFG